MLLFLFLSCQDDAFMPESQELISMRNSWPEDIALPMGAQPESITMGNGHTAYVSISAMAGAIYQIDLQTGEGEYLVSPAPGRVVAGVAFDARSNYLWVAGAFMGNLLVFDAGSGMQVAEFQLGDPWYPLPGTNPSSMVNDVVITKKAVYCTDSFMPVLYKIPLGPSGMIADGTEPETIFLSGEFEMTMNAPLGFPVNANGIDATPNGKHLVIVNTSSGILYHVDPMTGYATTIDTGGESMLFGDGIMLEPYDNGEYALYVVRNFMNMVAKLHLSEDLNSATLCDVITSTDPAFRIPTSVDAFGDGLYLVNARFDVAPPLEPAPDVTFNVVRVEN